MISRKALLGCFPYILRTMMVEMRIQLNHTGGFSISQTGVFVPIPRKAVLDVQMLTVRMRDSHTWGWGLTRLGWLPYPRLQVVLRGFMTMLED